MKVEIARIIPDPNNPRVMEVAPEKDPSITALSVSLQTIGLLQPIAVRRLPEDFPSAPNEVRPHYMLVYGHRRLAAAKIARWQEIEAQVLDLAPEEVIAAQVAENEIRKPLHPIGLFRASRKLIDAGMPAHIAASALGVTDRQMAQLAKLGTIIPEVLEYLEELPIDRFPKTWTLAKIANAPADLQRNAWAGIDQSDGREPGDAVNALASAVTVVRIPLSRAEFDHTLMRWDTDLFAEAGSELEYTTTDKDTFIALQKDWLKRKLKTRSKKFDCEYVESPDDISMTGWVMALKEAKKGSDYLERWWVSTEVYTFGSVVSRVYFKPEQDPHLASRKAADEIQEEARVAAEGEAEQEQGRNFTELGLQMIAAAKEVAVKEALNNPQHGYLALMWALLVAIAADNVEIRGEKTSGEKIPWTGWGNNRIYGLAPDHLATSSSEWPGAIARAVREAINRILIADAPRQAHGSGAALDVIGTALNAKEYMPTFDTEALLAQAKGHYLRSIWPKLRPDEKMPASVAAIRAALVNNAPELYPPEAEFSRILAPIPDEKIARGEAIDWDEDQEVKTSGSDEGDKT